MLKFAFEYDTHFSSFIPTLDLPEQITRVPSLYNIEAIANSIYEVIPMRKEFLLKDIDEEIYNLYESDIDIAYRELLIKETNNAILSLDAFTIDIPSLHISIRLGEYCTFDNEEECFMQDFSITLIYNEGETNLANYRYWEQDPPLVAIYNYFSSRYSLDELEQNRCYLYIE